MIIRGTACLSLGLRTIKYASLIRCMSTEAPVFDSRRFDRNFNVQPKKIAHGIQFKKEFGQHILKNPAIVDEIIRLSDLRPDDVVLEIGPGTGNLTMKLLDQARSVIGVELDTRMIAELKRRVKHTTHESKLTIIKGDVLKVPLPNFDVCVANIPYQISSPLIFEVFCPTKIPFRSAVIMLQKEFAHRLVSKPGDKLYCRLSAHTRLWANVEHLIEVDRSEFRPPPEVDSTVIRLSRKPDIPPVDFKEWDGLLKCIFNRKRRTLGALFRTTGIRVGLSQIPQNANTMSLRTMDEKTMLKEVQNRTIQVLEKTDLVGRRVYEMDTPDFLRLLIHMNAAGISFSGFTFQSTGLPDEEFELDTDTTPKRTEETPQKVFL